ncbi:CYTH domain-containing protein [Faecalimonas sp.]
MEIERKYLINHLPENLSSYPHRIIEQGYLSTDPVIRIRKDGEKYELTYKSKGLMIREEHTLPLTPLSYEHLKSKIDGFLITKERYNIPYDNHLTIELDYFLGDFSPLILAEVEFPDETSANAFIPPNWFGKDVTFSPAYQNSSLSQKGPLP